MFIFIYQFNAYTHHQTPIMGVRFTDKFSLLHLASGIVVYYWNMSFAAWFIAHAAFECIENTQAGMQVIRCVKLWPGGKTHADSALNRVGDQWYACLGWAIAHYYSTFV
jgi:hypothetical protein